MKAMSWRRALLLVVTGLVLSGTLLLGIALVCGGPDWVSSSARTAWRRLTPERRMSSLEMTLARYDWESLQHQPPLVSELESGQGVTLSVHGTGCFYSARYRIDIDGPTPLTATMTRLADDKAAEISVVRALTAEEAFRLDGAIAYYRTLRDDPHQYCTSSDEIRIDWHASGQSESFVDGSCLLLPDNPYALSPHDLAGLSISPPEP